MAEYMRLELPEDIQEKEKLLAGCMGEQIRISDWNFYSEPNPSFVEGRLIGLTKNKDEKFYALDLSPPHKGQGIFKISKLKILEVIIK